jgi:hypothetical protein
MAKHKVYYKGEGGGFLQVWAMVSLVNPCLLVTRPCTKVLQLRINQLVVWFAHVATLALACDQGKGVASVRAYK